MTFSRVETCGGQRAKEERLEERRATRRRGRTGTGVRYLERARVRRRPIATRRRRTRTQSTARSARSRRRTRRAGRRDSPPTRGRGSPGGSRVRGPSCHRRRGLRVVPYERMSGWSSKASVGVERRRGRRLKARDGRRDAPGKVLKDRRSPRRRGRMGTSVKKNAPCPRWRGSRSARRTSRDAPPWPPRAA